MNEGGGEREEDTVCPSIVENRKKERKKDRKKERKTERKKERKIERKKERRTDCIINLFPLSPAFFHEVKGHWRRDNITFLQKRHTHLCSILRFQLICHVHNKML